MRRRRQRGRTRPRDLVALAVALALLACATVLMLLPDAAPSGPDEPAASDPSQAAAAGDAKAGSLPASAGDTEDDGDGSEGQPSDGRSVRQTATGSITTWTAAGDLPEVASSVLVDYQDAGSCVLVHAGYLDLLGNVWCCTVTGDGWVDTCFVSERGEACEVRRQRVEIAKVEDAYVQEEAGVG